MAYAYAIRRGYYAAETQKHEGSLSPRDGRCPIALRSRPGETVIYSQLYEDEHCALERSQDDSKGRAHPNSPPPHLTQTLAPCRLAHAPHPTSMGPARATKGPVRDR